MSCTRADLDKLQCSNPDCDTPHDPRIVLTSQCHPGQGVKVTYTWTEGDLTLECRVCGGFVAKIQVAEE
jgi:hypothetical protein